MFDELYNKAKKKLAPKKEEIIAETKPDSPQQTETPPSSAVRVPPAIQPPSDAIKTTLSHDEQAMLLQNRKHIPGWILFLKYFSLTLIIVGLVGSVWIIADTNKDNKYLSIFNAPDNAGSKHERLKKVQKKLEQESLEYSGKIARIQRQLESKKYSLFTETIQKIRKQEINWFDTVDEEGNKIYGILEGPMKAAEYFNSKFFDNPILSNNENEVKIGEVSATRKNINFSVEASHLFGKAFFLNIEFVSFLNSFPIYKNGALTTYSKQEDASGNQGMKFSLKLPLQAVDEVDPDDVSFPKYEKWIDTFPPKKQ